MKVVLVRFVVVHHTQQIVQCELSKGNAFVHGVQIVRTHGANELTNQMEALGEGKGGTLIFVHLVSFVFEIVQLGAVRSNLFSIILIYFLRGKKRAIAIDQVDNKQDEVSNSFFKKKQQQHTP